MTGQSPGLSEAFGQTSHTFWCHYQWLSVWQTSWLPQSDPCGSQAPGPPPCPWERETVQQYNCRYNHHTCTLTNSYNKLDTQHVYIHECQRTISTSGLSRSSLSLRRSASILSLMANLHAWIRPTCIATHHHNYANASESHIPSSPLLTRWQISVRSAPLNPLVILAMYERSTS